MITSKICKICNQEKNIELFYFIKKRNLYRIICTECLNRQSREYKLKNKEKVKEARKKYYEENKEKKKQYAQINKEKIAERQRKYREKNHKTIIENLRKYYEKNREYLLEQKKEYTKTPIAIASRKNNNQRRRSAKKVGDVATVQILQLQQNAKKCYWCGCSLKNIEIHIDHYEPLSKGGSHTLSNLVVSCKKCNLSKRAKDPLVFANSIGKLL